MLPGSCLKCEFLNMYFRTQLLQFIIFFVQDFLENIRKVSEKLGSIAMKQVHSKPLLSYIPYVT